MPVKAVTNRFRDMVFNQPIDPLRSMIYQFIARTQAYPEALIVGAAATLIMICRHYKVSVTEVLEMAGRIVDQSLTYHSDPKGHVRAAWEYIQNELPAP